MENAFWHITCPFCKHRLHMAGQHKATQNERTGQHFIKTRYTCPPCDFWLTTEIPRKIALEHPPMPGYQFPAPLELATS